MPFSHYYGLWKNIPRCLPQIQMGLAGRLPFNVAAGDYDLIFRLRDPKQSLEAIKKKITTMNQDCDKLALLFDSWSVGQQSQWAWGSPQPTLSDTDSTIGLHHGRRGNALLFDGSVSSYDRLGVWSRLGFSMVAFGETSQYISSH